MATTGRNMQITVYRFDPDQDSKPYPVAFTVDVSQCRGVMLLDALEYIKSHLDESLSFRRSCNEGRRNRGRDGHGKRGTWTLPRFWSIHRNYDY